MEKFYVDCSGWLKFKAENKDDAKEKFWDFVYKLQQELDVEIYVDSISVESAEGID